MSLALILNGLGSMGLFASRAFLPAFLTALLLRFGGDLPWIGQLGLLDSLPGAPSWFTHDVTLVLLGVLTLVELLATKSPEARELLLHVDKYLKVGMAALTFLGVANASDVAFVDEQIQEAGLFLIFPILMVAGGVFALASLRARVLGLVSEADADDSSGVQGILSWLEDAWAGTGVLVLVLFPILMVVLIFLATGVLVLLERRAQAREERSKVPCQKCGESMYLTAITCPKCKERQASPRQVNWLGGATEEPVADPASQPYRLLEKKRCPECATRFTERAVHQECTACGHALFARPELAQAYVDHVASALPRVLLVAAGLSLIPVVGLIPGVLYYRVKLVAPFRRYLPFLTAATSRWGLRIFFLFLIALQWIPAVGGVVVPLMAVTSYGVYRAAFLRSLENADTPTLSTRP